MMMMVVVVLTALPPDARRSADGSRLVITNVNPHDAGVLQCAAENEHGAILANAILTVAGLSLIHI